MRLSRTLRVALSLTALSLTLLGPGCANRAQKSLSLYEAGDYAGAARAADEGLAVHPDDRGLWQMRIRAALALGDSAAVGRGYAAYRATLDGEDDRELLRDLGVATLGQALASPSAKLKLIAIDAVAKAELQALAEQVAERMEDQDDRVVAAAAAAILRGFHQAPEAADQMLRSEDPEARRIAVDGIGRKIGKVATPELVKAADDPDPRVRQAAIRWLGHHRIREAVPVLLRQLRHADDNVRAGAVTALARIGEGDLAAVGKQALADKALAVRLAAIDAMVAAKQATELAQVAQSDPDPMVAIEAAIAIRSQALAAQPLERAATSESWNIRAAAANIAARAVGKAASLALAQRLAGDREVGVRLAAGRVLAYHGDRAGAIAIFAPALDSEQALAAATELARLDDERGLAALEQAIRDDKRTPDARAAAAAAHLMAKRVTPALVAALADSSGLVRVEAATALVLLSK